MSAILFDLDGVLYEGDTAVKGAAEAVDWVVTNNIPHLFLTNTTSKPRSALVEKLAGYGINTNEDEYLTPPVASIVYLNNHQAKNIALFIPDVTQSEYSDFKIIENNEPVDAVIVGDLAQQWSFEKLNQAFTLLMNNPEAVLIALGLTRYWKTDKGLQLDAGPFVKALEYATGREAIVTGKPAEAFYKAAVSSLNTSDIYMIGDDIQGDIEASQRAGLKAIQVRTGKYRESDLKQGITPDAVLDSIADLPSWWH